ncbi:TetR/AcrR family transcriptional regulator [Sedimentibacter sp. zth1]|uniref:TetR/AcrR family transcriptional regulator n=1 Tax=Sedimentibacter sp. zth1 TaxID=2816908 RepID=UPI001A935B95|nr:TetR/AcrR family transcriptional regulator [Sedimentibacter sp. zth1]QSX04870.1 TetR/AcrR family transcriptional regulator [Sedimentibacter sp. zth1]
MPKNTFLNLKDEKKQKIKAAAISEFAQYGIQNASVNRIVKSAGIATGSFYQYFEGIKDLFIYIIVEIANEKLQYLQQEFEKVSNNNLEELLKSLYRGGIRFAVQNEDACKIANSILQIKDTPLFSEIMKQMPQTNIYTWIIPLIDEAIKKGEIRKGITTELFIMLIVNINLTIIEYIGSLNKNHKFEFSEKDFDQFSALAVGILLNGIK